MTPLFKSLDEVCASLGPQFKVRWLREQLAHGKFRGIGHKHGRTWMLTDGDVNAIVERMAVPAHDLDLPHPSGLSPNSRKLKAALREQAGDQVTS